VAGVSNVVDFRFRVQVEAHQTYVVLQVAKHTDDPYMYDRGMGVSYSASSVKWCDATVEDLLNVFAVMQAKRA
jgi:hypothetical protein